MRTILQSVLLMAVIGAAIVIGGCSNSPTSSGYGRLQLTLVDAPCSFDKVNIYVTRVEAHMANADSLSGWVVIDSQLQYFDLLKLRNGLWAALGDKQLPVGMYTQIRLHVADTCSVVIGGVKYSLGIPSQTGLKLNHPFTIVQDQLVALTLDFDVCKSINEISAGQYRLDPVIRVVATVISGSISGVVHPVSTRADVVAFNASDTVMATADSTTGYFKIMALPAASYTVHVIPTDALYKDTTISNVAVTAMVNTSLDTIVLPLK